MYLDHTTAEEDLALFTTYTKSDLTSPAINIYTSTIRSLCLQLSLGNLTSLEIVTAYLRQIEVYNPRLKALIHVGPREGLMAYAREMDYERKEGKCRGVLHGIPIVLKWVSRLPQCQALLILIGYAGTISKLIRL